MNWRDNFSAKPASPPGRLSEMRAAAALFWSARNRRERSLIALAGAVVGLGLLYALLIDPALQGRVRLQQSLPALRLQAAQLQALAKQAAALPAAAAPAAADVSKESIQALLQDKGLPAQSVDWSGDVARLQFKEASFGALLDAVQVLQQAARLTVVEATITAAPAAGSVNASLTLHTHKAD